MKKLYRFLSSMAIAASLVFNLSGPITALAATTPSLGLAVTYGVLSSTYTNTTATTINGDVGFTTPPAVVPAGVHPNYGPGAPYANAGADQGIALSSLTSQLCTFTFAAGAINLSTDVTHGIAGVYAPGVYCSSGAMNIGGPLTLSGSGTYIFRPSGALTSTAGSVVTLAGASACDIFWTPTEAITLAANTTFIGTAIDDAGITVGANTIWTGRALAFGGTVTTDTHVLTVPTCTIPPVPATLHVIKTIINGSSSALPSDFSLHVKTSGTDVAGSPMPGASAPGTSYSLSAATYIVSENPNAAYTQTFSGACNSSGSVTLISGDDKTCTVVNTLIPLAMIPISPGSGPGVVIIPTPVVPTITPVATTPTPTTTTTAQIFTTAAPTSDLVLDPTSTAPVPGFPKTGAPAQDNTLPWNLIFPAVIIFGSIFYVLRKKQA
ncbi:MAG: ice-binding family protein [Candidatus Gracilibacteria bacterium]